MRGSREIFDPWSGDGGIYADTVFTQEGRLTEVLGPDGNPVRYLERHPIGFDLRPRNKREQETRR